MSKRKVMGLGEGEDEFGGVTGGAGLGEGLHSVFLLTPEGGVVSEEGLDGAVYFLGAGSEGADLEASEEFDIPFFLSGDDVVDEHGTLGGEGFVDGGSSGFSDDEVVTTEEFGDFTGPAFDADAAGMF